MPKHKKSVSILARTSIFLCIFSLISSCSTANYKAEKKNGFLSDYSGLTPIKNDSDALSWQWREKNLSLDNYSQLYIDPLVFYPKPLSSNQISKDMLSELRNSTNELLRTTAAKKGINLTTGKGPKVLVLHSAITSAKIKLKDLSLTELIPIRLIFFGTQLALGDREKDLVLLFEYELLDSETGKVLIRGIQYSPKISLKYSKNRVTKEDIKLVLENVIRYLDRNFNNLAAELQK
ncbi:MAG: DUF3313 domain-containing protein [Pseudomonadales bacterium]|nr:DUF3313 domain-containing protein [Pseudomonadales bacterium]